MKMLVPGMMELHEPVGGGGGGGGVAPLPTATVAVEVTGVPDGGVTTSVTVYVPLGYVCDAFRAVTNAEPSPKFQLYVCVPQSRL